MITSSQINHLVLQLEQTQASCEEYTIGRHNDLENLAVDHAADVVSGCLSLTRDLLRLQRVLRERGEL